MTDQARLAQLPRAAVAAAIRDVPDSCSCPWAWVNRTATFTRSGHTLGCEWHTKPPAPAPALARALP